MSLRVKTETGDIIVADVGGGGGGASTAEEVSYDNTASGLIADNVQDAIDVMKDEFYTEIEHVNTSIASKANADEVYTKAETYAKTEVYTKTQTDKAITDEVAKIVADAPEDFDTLKEMSDWISNHEESAAAMNTAISGKITAPQTATVGQILSVKAVDTSGKPTEWETADKPEGGGINVTALKTDISLSTTKVSMGFNPSSTNLKLIVVTGSSIIPLIIPVSLFTNSSCTCYTGMYISSSLSPVKVTLTTNGEISSNGSAGRVNIFGIS